MKKELLIIGGLAIASLSQAQVLFSGTYNQNFDTLPSATPATWTDNSTLTGWFQARTGANTLLVSDGSSNAGGVYSFGTAGSSNRAIGSVSSGTPVTINWGFELTNQTGAVLNTLNFAFTQENWRSSTSVTNVDPFTFSKNATSIGDAAATWVSNTSGDLNGPAFGSTNGALDGTDPANQSAHAFSLTGLGLASGASVWVRWTDVNDAGNDAGLGIDNLSVTSPAVTPEPGTLAALGLGAMVLIRRRRNSR